MDRVERAGQFWQRTAASYDRQSALLERRFLAGGRRWVTTRATGNTLEVCIGTGANLPLYDRDITLTGLDWSAAMLEQTRHKAAEAGRAIDLHHGDAGDLPFEDATFDSVVCTYGLCCVPDHRRALADMIRVLRPGGALLLADHVPSTNPAFRLLQHGLEAITARLHGEHFTRRPRAELPAVGAAVVDERRSKAGVIEVVHATA